MTLHSTLFSGNALISQIHYGYQDAGYVLTAPPRAAFIRASMVGGGAHRAGAAFARKLAAATPGETFNLFVGVQEIESEGGLSSDSTLTRVTGNVLLCRAARATPGVAGSVANSIGDTRRAGVLGTDNIQAGASGSDEGDTLSLGIGGPGAYMAGLNRGNEFRAAYPGGGGFYSVAFNLDGTNSATWTILAGQGRACIQFFDRNPTNWPA